LAGAGGGGGGCGVSADGLEDGGTVMGGIEGEPAAAP
jgi:hypothetical protein